MPPSSAVPEKSPCTKQNTLTKGHRTGGGVLCQRLAHNVHAVMWQRWAASHSAAMPMVFLTAVSSDTDSMLAEQQADC